LRQTRVHSTERAVVLLKSNICCSARTGIRHICTFTLLAHFKLGSQTSNSLRSALCYIIGSSSRWRVFEAISHRRQLILVLLQTIRLHLLHSCTRRACLHCGLRPINLRHAWVLESRSRLSTLASESKLRLLLCSPTCHREFSYVRSMRTVLGLWKFFSN